MLTGYKIDCAFLCICICVNKKKYYDHVCLSSVCIFVLFSRRIDLDHIWRDSSRRLYLVPLLPAWLQVLLIRPFQCSRIQFMPSHSYFSAYQVLFFCGLIHKSTWSTSALRCAPLTIIFCIRCNSSFSSSCSLSEPVDAVKMFVSLSLLPSYRPCDSAYHYFTSVTFPAFLLRPSWATITTTYDDESEFELIAELKLAVICIALNLAHKCGSALLLPARGDNPAPWWCVESDFVKDTRFKCLPNTHKL